MANPCRIWRRQLGAWVAAGLALAASGCEGVIESGAPSGPGVPGSLPQADGGSRVSARDPDEAGYDGDDLGAYDQPAPSTRLARLTHAQWQNTVQDLLGLEEVGEQLEGLRADPRQAGFLFDNQADALSVDEALLRGYERAAAALAARVTADPAALSELAPQAGTNRERAEHFVREVGLHAHRRPLSEDQLARYLELFDAGPALYDGMDDFAAGARLVLEAMLQSPHFLYRFEASQAVVGSVIPLDDYEVATRLSYFLWDTMPDAELFAAAAAGELTQAAGAARHAARMLSDPRGRDMLVRFHAQLLDAERYDTIAPSPTVFESSGQLGAHARREQALFVGTTLAEESGSFADLLTSPRTFVNAELARVYGLEGAFGEQFEAVDLDPNQRAGLFTQVGFLALNATARHPDPIHRGAFMAKRVACITISAPPDEIPPLPDPAGRTNRQRVQDHTEQEGSTCAGCHKALINPLGFPFESYDAAGRWRTEDLGMPVDTAAEPLIDARATAVSGAVDMVHAMARSEVAHECYAKHWVEFAYGREDVREDEGLITRLTNESLADGASVLELLVSMVRSEAFLTRSEQELP